MKTKVKITITEAIQLQSLCTEAKINWTLLDNRSIFEKSIDYISDKLFGGKSCMPNELRSF